VDAQGVARKLTGRHRKQRWRYTNSASLYDLLQGSLYHTTTLVGLSGIVSTGFIHAGGDLAKASWPGGYPHRMGLISLFDFLNVERHRAVKVEDQWAKFFLSCFCEPEQIRIALRLDRALLDTGIILNAPPPTMTNANGNSYSPKYIRDVEVWSPKSVSSSYVNAVLLYDVRMRRGFEFLEAGPTLLGRALSAAQRYARQHKRHRVKRRKVTRSPWEDAAIKAMRRLRT